MSSFNIYHPTYNNLTEYVSKGKNKLERTIGNNTKVIKSLSGDIMIQYHSSIIAVLNQDTVMIDPCGWYTLTTKERINWILDTIGYRITQSKGEWILYKYHNWNNPVGSIHGQFTYNHYTGLIEGLTPLNSNKHSQDMKRIKQYCQAYIDKFFSGELESPNGGDCWHCYMSFPDSFEHIDSHIEESYYVPSLLLKAIQFKTVSQVAMWVINSHWYDTSQDTSMFNDIAKDQLYKSLLAYCKHCYDTTQ